MKIGVCTTDFRSQPVESLFDEVKSYGFTQVQFSFDSIGEEQIPVKIAPHLTKDILKAANERGLEIVAVNGTFNMISPYKNERKTGIERFEGMAVACHELGCNILTLCTGTKNPNSMWEGHPDNSTRESWTELLETTKALIQIAEKHEVYLGVETEASNVVSSAELARKYLDEISSPYLKIVMDCANLFAPGMAYPSNVRTVIGNAFELLGHDIIIAHGKDILPSSGIEFTSAGKGIVDFDFFLSQLKQYGYTGGMMLHGIKEKSDFPYCVEFIRRKIAQHDM